MTDAADTCHDFLGWMKKFGPWDIDHGEGVRFAQLLALVARTPTGSRVDDGESGLSLEAVTKTDRLFALQALFTLTSLPHESGHPVLRSWARALVEGHGLWGV
ncbi:MAG TPA: hypothetical protein VGJ83_04540, partial [Gemmatimonadales bacterium]